MSCERNGWSRFDLLTAVAVSLIVQTTISLLAGSVPVLAPVIAAERGWNPSIIAFYPTVVYLVAFLFSFEVPHLLQRFGGMGLSLACVAVSALGLLGLLGDAALTIVAPIAVGCATGAMNPASSQILGPRTTPRSAGLIMSIKQTGVPLGGVVAGSLAPWLLWHMGLRGAIVSLAVISLAVVLVFLPSRRRLDGNTGRVAPQAFRPLESLAQLLAIPGMLGFLVAGFAFSVMQICLRTFLAVYLVNDQGRSLELAGLAFSVSQAAGIVGQVAWAAVSDRLLAPRLVMGILGLLMTAAAALTAVMTPSWSVAAIVIVALLFGGTASAFIPIVLGEIARRSTPGQVGTMTSGAQVFLLGGALVGPLAFGGLASQWGFAAAFLALALCSLLAVALLAVPQWMFSSRGAAASRIKTDPAGP